jgi:ribonuclease HII
MKDMNFPISWKQGSGNSKTQSYLRRDFIGPLICGVDEAGRGPLAGPVVAAAVILCDGFDTAGIRDSKLLSPAQRQRQRDRLLNSPCLWGVGVVNHEIIDQLNILQASFRAMKLAIEAIGVAPESVLVDGCHQIPELAFRQKAIIGGDTQEPSIAAASILAKTHRDGLMIQFADHYPEYGFEKHKGYATQQHLSMILRYGPCPIHRKSFHPISTYFPKSNNYRD